MKKDVDPGSPKAEIKQVEEKKDKSNDFFAGSIINAFIQYQKTRWVFLTHLYEVIENLN